NFSYFATPEFLTITFHILTIIDIPIHMFGAYLIQNSNCMRSVKWSMLNLHFWSVLLDWLDGFLSRPFMLYPALAGYTEGVLVRLGMSTAAMAYLFFTLFCAVTISIFGIMENIFNILFAENHIWRKIRFPYFMINWIFVLTHFLYPIFNTPNQKHAIEFLKNRLPEIDPSVFRHPNFLVLSLDLKPVFPIVLACFLGTWQTMVFVYLIVSNLEKCAKTMTLSKTTLKMQTKFLRAISIQIVVPLIVLAMPMFYIGISIVANFYNQVLNILITIIVSTHGLASTFVMLIIHEPYWKYCRTLF
ncbi:LOW QUALITY PROTEIN: Protein CBG10354, partial [Caenorhabditis briggsae]